MCLLCLFVLLEINLGYSQDKKSVKRSIIITNGDTIVNGKKFSELNIDERVKLRKEFKEMEGTFKSSPKFGKKNEVFIRLRNNDDARDELSFNFENKMPGDLHVFKYNGDSSMTFGFSTDSLIKRFNFKMNGLDSNLKKRIITMHRDRVPGFPGTFNRIEMPQMNFERQMFSSFGERNNSSTFNYNFTDKDGISSSMSIRLGDATKDQLKKITGAETISNPLDASDLILFPNFSSGKMTLSFNIASKGNTKVAILDSDFKPLFNDEVSNFSGNYVKQISLPKNGVYYITVSQNGNWLVRRLVKE